MKSTLYMSRQKAVKSSLERQILQRGLGLFFIFIFIGVSFKQNNGMLRLFANGHAQVKSLEEDTKNRKYGVNVLCV